MAEYKIQGETLTGIADQVRRISGVEGELTPEQMTTNLLNVTPLGEYPKAEESTFGEDPNSTFSGISLSETATVSGSSKTSVAFQQFRANQAFAILGLRVILNGTTVSDSIVNLHNAAGEIIRTCTITTKAQPGWFTAYFDEPVNIAINEVFTISRSKAYYYYTSASGSTINDKVTWLGSTVDDSTTVPSSGLSTKYFYGIVDFIGSLVDSKLPDDYQITRTTMDDIAEEVQRITGTECKMTTAQIINALQGVAVQSSE